MSKFKRVLTVLVCVVFVLALLGGCGSQQTPSDDSSDSTNEVAEEAKLRILFTNAWYSAPYCAPLNEAANKRAQELGIDLQIVDGQGDAQVQLDQIQNAIAQGFDGILYFPADQASTVTIIRAIHESGTPFLVINSRADPSVEDLIGTFVGPDYYEQGLSAGRMAMDALGEKGGNVVVIEGGGGTEAQRERSRGFEEVIAANQEIMIIGSQQADWDPAKAMSVMEDFITTFGDQIDLVYTQDDGMFQGASKALTDAGMMEKVIAVSIGANKAGIAAVKAGELFGTASQSPQDEGKMAIESILRLINGETLPAWIKTESVPVTIENVDQFDGQGW